MLSKAEMKTVVIRDFGCILFENPEIINAKFEYRFMLITIPTFLVILLLNISVVMKVLKEEKTIVNRLMMLECIMNILGFFLLAVQQSPYYRGFGREEYCYPHMMLVLSYEMFNRLLPVAIGLFR